MALAQTADLRARRFKSLRTILALMLREMSTTYGKSPGGYVWAVLEPVAAITVLAVGFSLAFRAPAIGTNFILFFATGYLPFSMALDTMNKVAKSITFSRALLAYPAVTHMDAILARLLLNIITHVLIMGLVLAGILIFYQLNIILHFPSILLSLALAFALGLGIGSVNCYLYLTFPIWERVWTVVTRPLFLVSGVLFLYDSMPTLLKDIMWYNPLVHVTGLSRRGFYATYEAEYVSLPFGFGIAMGCMTLGFLLLFRHHRALMNA